jgi:hypothetical protein
LNQGLDGEADVTSLIVRLGIERVVQEMVEQEVTDALERDHYQRRRPEQEHRGYRNGYEPGRIRTAEGEIVVQVPQVRDAPQTYRSRLMIFLRGNSDVLERLAVEMYARGLSTRDIEDALEEATGDRLLSRTAVSQITEILWDEYEAFAEILSNVVDRHLTGGEYRWDLGEQQVIIQLLCLEHLGLAIGKRHTGSHQGHQMGRIHSSPAFLGSQQQLAGHG